MSDKFSFNGDFQVAPLVGSPAFVMSAIGPITESLVIKNWKRASIDLNSDSPVAVNFDQLAGAHVVVLAVIEGGPKALATISSGDGASQLVPFEYFVLGSQTVPIVAISLTRVSGTATKVQVFIAEKA